VVRDTGHVAAQRAGSAVQPGGDTDTVAALAGGLMGCKLAAGQVRAELPWHRLVILPEPETAIAEPPPRWQLPARSSQCEAWPPDVT
jgi:hypothetical protein